MGIKVKTKVNFNEIIEKLHKVAKDFAEKKSAGKVELENIAFNDQDGKFLGGGEFAIFMKQKEGVVSENDKGKFLDIIKEYVHYFVGEEETKYVDEDSLQPIYLDSTAGQEEVEDIKKKKEEEEKQKAEKQEKERRNLSLPSGSFNVNNESRFFKTETNKILNLLFESDGEDETKDDNNDNEVKCIGYGVAYTIEENGKTDWTIAKAISNKAKGLFGGIAADLLNIKIKIGGEPVNLGHVLDPKKWAEKLGFKDIDASQVAQDMKKAFDNDFKHNEAQISVEDNEYLKSSLNRMTKNSTEFRKKMEEGKGLFSGLMSKLKKCKYSVLIQVKEKDPWYPKYNIESIAKTASKAFGTTYNAVDWNKVSKNDVIKIDNAEHIKPQKKEWDPNQALRDLLDKNKRENEKDENKDNKKSKNLNEENEQSNESLIDKILDKNSRDKFGDRVKKCGCQTLQDFTQNNFIESMENGDFLEDIKTKYDSVLYLILNENAVNETLINDMENNILKLLFESESKKDIDSVTEIFKNTFVEIGDQIKPEQIKVDDIKVYERTVDIADDDMITEKNHKKLDDKKYQKFIDLVKNNLTDIRNNKDKVLRDSLKNGYKDFENVLFDNSLNTEETLTKLKNITHRDNFRNDIVYKFKFIPTESTQEKGDVDKQSYKLFVTGNILEDQKEISNNDTSAQKVDWYIIPHRGIKDKGDRNMQRSTDSHGVTTTSTSDKEYKPKGK